MINVASIVIHGVNSSEEDVRCLRPRADSQVVEVDIGHVQGTRAASDGSLIVEGLEIRKSGRGDGHIAILTVHICCIRGEAGNR